MKHLCHWPGCPLAVSPSQWGCAHHWFRLPAPIRAEIWRTYVRGQELRKDPSTEYLAAARAAHEWALSADGLRPVPLSTPLVREPGPQS